MLSIMINNFLLYEYYKQMRYISLSYMIKKIPVDVVVVVVVAGCSWLATSASKDRPAISIRSLRKGEKGEARPAVVLLNNGLLIYEKDQIDNKLILLFAHVIG